MWAKEQTLRFGSSSLRAVVDHCGWTSIPVHIEAMCALTRSAYASCE